MGGGKTDDADLAAGLRLVAKVSLVYVFEAFIITFIDLMTAKVQRIFETTKCFYVFLSIQQKKSRRARALRDERYVKEMYYSSI